MLVDGVTVTVGDTADDDICGQGPALIVSLDDLGPTSAPLSIPPAVILYATSHTNPSTVTVAIPLIIWLVS